MPLDCARDQERVAQGSDAYVASGAIMSGDTLQYLSVKPRVF